MHRQSELILESLIHGLAHGHLQLLEKHWLHSTKMQYKLCKKTLEIFEGSLANVEASMLDFKDRPRLTRLAELYFPKTEFPLIVQACYDEMKSYMCTHGALLQNSASLISVLTNLVKESLFQFIELEETVVPTPQVNIIEKIVMSEEGAVQKRVYVFPKDLTKSTASRQ